MRNAVINTAATIAAALVGWGPKAAEGLAITQRAEPLRNIPANLWGWTHDDEWDERALCAIADDPTLFTGRKTIYERVMDLVPTLSNERLEQMYLLIEIADATERMGGKPWSQSEIAALIISVGEEILDRC